jgi:hypothetical protein
MVDAFLTNCRLADGRLVDIGIAGVTIAAVGEGAASLSNSAPALDMRTACFWRRQSRSRATPQREPIPALSLLPV